MKKITLFIILAMLPFLLGSSYNYSFYGDVVYSVPGMTFSTYFNEHTLGVKFDKPEYFVVYENEIYVIDSGNNSLYVIDANYHVKPGFPKQEFNIEAGSVDKDIFIGETKSEDEKVIIFNKPEGLEIRDNIIYIADTQNRRIVKMNMDFEVIDLFKDPEDPVFKDIKAFEENERLMREHEEAQNEAEKAHNEEQKYLPEIDRTPYERVPNPYSSDDVPGVLFYPSKITVDNTERMYVIANNVFEGILELSPTGEFNRFTGVNPLKLSAAEIFRRSLMSEAQKAKLTTFLPTSFTSVKMGDGNFIYATARASSGNDKNMIQLINPKGLDVIKKNGYVVPMGDSQFMTNVNNHVVEGPSILLDIDYTEGGIYSVLDNKRSRIFTYDMEGNLLYITGSQGSQSDKFTSGVSLGYLGDKIIVLDQNSKTFVVYEPSNFGKLVNEAVRLEYEGDFESSKDVWEEIVRINVNYEIAYGGIGRYYLREKNYKEAVKYFKLSHSTYYYSKAYQNYRNEILRRNFGWIFAGGLLIMGAVIGKAVYKKYMKGDKDED